MTEINRTLTSVWSDLRRKTGIAWDTLVQMAKSLVKKRILIVDFVPAEDGRDKPHLSLK